MKLSGKIAEKGLHAFDKEPRTHGGIEVPRLWVVVADREKAHIYRKTPKGIERIADAKTGHAGSHHQEAGSGGTVHHGYDVKSEKRHHKDSGFIQKLTEWLESASRENVFDRLILVASPHTLGDIRSSLGKNIQARITAEVDKDLIKLSEKEIEEHLSNVVWF